MDSSTCFLITLLNGNALLRCAIKVREEDLHGDIAEYPMEPENQEALHKLLPEHVQSVGPIVDVETIFEIRA